MFRKTASLVLLITFVCAVRVVHAQSETNTPFTLQGIGEVRSLGLAHNRAMGDVGYSNYHPKNLNVLNPALLPFNTWTTFEAGAFGESKTISNETESIEESSANLGYLALGFPVKPGKWTIALGLSPYTKVNYSITGTDLVNGTQDTVNTRFEGLGGLNQVYLMTGYKLTKELYVGGSVRYYFGSVDAESATSLESQGAVSQLVVLDRTSFSDFGFGVGVVYSKNLATGEKKDEAANQRLLNIGAITEFENSLGAEQLLTIERRTLGGLVTSVDSVNDGLNGSVVIPPRYGVGISYQIGFRWTFAVDVTYQDWTQFRNFQGNNEGLETAQKIGAGIQWTPDYNSVNKYLERITYRFGASYENTPFVTNGNQVNEFGINFGASLPVGRSLINLAAGYGQRGNVENNLLGEEFFRFSLGITFNDYSFSFFKNIRKFD